MTKKEIALSLIVPYIKDRSLIAYDTNNKACAYKTHDGKMCIAGKCMINPENQKGTIVEILLKHPQKEILKSEFVDVFSINEWSCLQSMHDSLSNTCVNDKREIKTFFIQNMERLGLFDFHDLKEAGAEL